MLGWYCTTDEKKGDKGYMLDSTCVTILLGVSTRESVVKLYSEFLRANFKCENGKRYEYVCGESAV
jgi:hypothetical protein